jgi:hypothetical protein
MASTGAETDRPLISDKDSMTENQTEPSVGRIVHFVQNYIHYAAVIVKVWTINCVNLRVLPNGSDVITPGALDERDIAHSVTYSEPRDCCGKCAEWSWHWPERVL